jgi:hypothetical protein
MAGAGNNQIQQGNPPGQRQLMQMNPGQINQPMPALQPMPAAQPMPALQPPIGSNINQTAATGINNAISATTGELGYQPHMVGNIGNSATIGYGGTSPMVTPTGQSSTVQAGQVASTDLNAYMNPYTQQVIDANEADILRGANQGLDMLGAQAQAGKAFGGSRHGIAMGEMGRDVVSQLAQSSAGLRQGGFDRATSLAQGDIANRMQAGLANQQASQFDIGTGMQADLANQSASQYDATKNFEAYQANQRANQFDISNQMQAALANQSAGLQGSQNRQGAAGQLGSLSNLGFGMGQEVTNNLSRQGTQQQALQQALIDAAKGQFGGMTGAPATGLGYLNQALGVTQSGQTQTNTKDPGLFDYLTLAGSMM